MKVNKKHTAEEMTEILFNRFFTKRYGGNDKEFCGGFLCYSDTKNSKEQYAAFILTGYLKNKINMSFKLLHLERLTGTPQHSYYGSLEALLIANGDLPYHTIKRLKIETVYETEAYKIFPGELLTTGDVKNKNKK